jgi:co-chaperonin GroES (HSP10)
MDALVTFPNFDTIHAVSYEPAKPEEWGIIPLKGRILVELVRFETRTVEKLFLDATVEQPTEHGVVLQIGAGVDTKARVGDVVMIGRYSGYQIENERFALVREDDMVAIRTVGYVKPKDGARHDSGLTVPERPGLLLPHG